jgi:hypothetical protein
MPVGRDSSLRSPILVTPLLQNTPAKTDEIIGPFHLLPTPTPLCLTFEDKEVRMVV